MRTQGRGMVERMMARNRPRRRKKGDRIGIGEMGGLRNAFGIQRKAVSGCFPQVWLDFSLNAVLYYNYPRAEE